MLFYSSQWNIACQTIGMIQELQLFKKHQSSSSFQNKSIPSTPRHGNSRHVWKLPNFARILLCLGSRAELHQTCTHKTHIKLSFYLSILRQCISPRLWQNQNVPPRSRDEMKISGSTINRPEAQSVVTPAPGFIPSCMHFFSPLK